ncbi:hypothetical protein AB5I41_02090 [Sphingomonas sp. MMS24-JH45]
MFVQQATGLTRSHAQHGGHDPAEDHRHRQRQQRVLLVDRHADQHELPAHRHRDVEGHRDEHLRRPAGHDEDPDRRHQRRAGGDRAEHRLLCPARHLGIDGLPLHLGRYQPAAQQDQRLRLRLPFHERRDRIAQRRDARRLLFGRHLLWHSAARRRGEEGGVRHDDAGHPDGERQQSHVPRRTGDLRGRGFPREQLVQAFSTERSGDHS